MRRSTVRVISRKKIREASERHSEWEASLSAWYRIVKKAAWKNFPDVKQSWRNSDKAGTCIIFDISGNRCRLIAYINFRTQKVYVLHILSHVEYGRDRWKNDCGCD